MFITFEGGEGAGKTTQIKLLAEYLRSRSKKVVTTFEPGGTMIGKALRKILLSQGKVPPLTELLLFAADRAEHVEKVIKPALKKGYIVLCDRYVDSTLAYQVGGRKLSFDLVEFFNKASSQKLMPDLTFLLNIEAKVGIKRAINKTRFEKEKFFFHERIRRYFLELARGNPKRIKVIDSSRKIKDVQEEILRICAARIFAKHS